MDNYCWNCGVKIKDSGIDRDIRDITTDNLVGLLDKSMKIILEECE